jgi:hypothetical protein
MQSAPSEDLQTANPLDQSLLAPNTVHHGSPDHPAQASGRLPQGTADREPSPEPDDADTISIASSRSRRGRRANAEWLSSRSSSSQEGSPGHRIEEYERAHKSLRKPSTGVIFQVIPSDKDANNRISVEQFPNGQSRHAVVCIAVLTCRRGPDPYPLEP